MGMSIDNTCEPKPMSKEEIVDTLKTMVFGVQAFKRFNAKERETLDKAWNLIDQYENRLKADMVAMLTEIQMEYKEYGSVWMQWNETMSKEKIAHEVLQASKDRMIDLLEEKIDKLKGAN